MERYDQNPIETLESQAGGSPLGCQESNSAPRSYCAPQVLLVGKAQRLMAGGGGDDYDSDGYLYTQDSNLIDESGGS